MRKDQGPRMFINDNLSFYEKVQFLLVEEEPADVFPDQTSHPNQRLLMPFDGPERPTQAKGEAVLLPSPGPGFCAAGPARPWVVWFGALNAGGHSEFKEPGVPFMLHPGLIIHKVRLTMAVLASSSAKTRG